MKLNTKICGKCNLGKNKIEFHKKVKDLERLICKTCCSKYSKERYKDPVRREQIRANLVVYRTNQIWLSNYKESNQFCDGF